MIVRRGAAPTARNSGIPVSHTGGFTLMEVLVAMTILSLTLVVLYQAFSSNVYLVTSSRSMWRAMEYVNNELMKWERQGTASVSVDQGTFARDHPMAGFSWKREVADQDPIPGIRVRKVSYQLTWDEGTSKRNYQSYIYVKPN